MKIGIIGLGDIAQKAYLPVIHKKNIELHLHTRSEATLLSVAKQYRIEHCHSSLESLIQSGIKGAFVHAPTDAHEPIVDRLLSNGIHVHVDKPVSYDYNSTARLVTLAEKNKLFLRVGFNRRFAPSYQKMKAVAQPNMIVMQKNRKSLPGAVRKFVFDDFIHVVDTLLWLFPKEVEEITISGRKKEGQLYHAMIQLLAHDGTVGIGIMNRDAGTTEETVEVFSTEEKQWVRNFTDVAISQATQEVRVGGMDWGTTLHRRGFEQMIDAFLDGLEKPFPSDRQAEEQAAVLLTHKICEQVVAKLEGMK